MKLKPSHYIHDISNLQIVGITQPYYSIPLTHRIIDYKRCYNDNIKCFPVYKNTSIYFGEWLLINII